MAHRMPPYGSDTPIPYLEFNLKMVKVVLKHSAHLRDPTNALPAQNDSPSKRWPQNLSWCHKISHRLRISIALVS